MASNYTTNYKLPLWEGGDDFVREEFNEAHEKVDAALAQATDRVRLMEMTTTEDAQQIDLDVSGIDLADYEYITIYITNVNVSESIFFRLNNISSSVYYHGDVARAYLFASSPMLTGAGSIELRISGQNGAIFCRKTAEYLFKLDGEYFPYGNQAMGGPKSSVLKPNELTSVNLYVTNSTIPAGVHFRVIGTLKK